MAETKITGVRIPEQILEQVDELGKREGKTRSQAIIELIRRGLGVSADIGADTATVLGRIEALEKKLLNCWTTGKTLNNV